MGGLFGVIVKFVVTRPDTRDIIMIIFAGHGVLYPLRRGPGVPGVEAWWSVIDCVTGSHSRVKTISMISCSQARAPASEV